MNKDNKPEITHYEHLERIETRLAELALVQKLLFYQYLDVAEKAPSTHQRIREIYKKIPFIQKKEGIGEPIEYKTICQQLEIEERSIKLQREKLDYQRLCLEVTQMKKQEQQYEQSQTRRLYEENMTGIPLNKTSKKMDDEQDYLYKNSIFLLILFLGLSLVYLATVFLF